MGTQLSMEATSWPRLGRARLRPTYVQVHDCWVKCTVEKVKYFHLCLHSFTHSANISCHSLGAGPVAFPRDILSGSDRERLDEMHSFSNSGSAVILFFSQQPDKVFVVLPGKGSGSTTLLKVPLIY